MLCVVWEEWKMKLLLPGFFISQMQLCSLAKTHTYTHGVAVEAQQESWQLDCLTNDFSPTSYPILSLSQVWYDNDAQDKSAVCHTQVKADPVKLFTCTFKTWQLSIVVAKPVNICEYLYTHFDPYTDWTVQLNDNCLTGIYL